MSDDGDPRRWRHDDALDPELRALLDAGAAEVPHPEQLERLEARLFPPLPPGGSSGPSGGSGGSASGGAPLAKIGLAALAASAGIAITIALATPGPRSGDVAEVSATSPRSVADASITRDPADAGALALAPPDAGTTLRAPPRAPRLERHTAAPTELELLDEAQAALATSPSRALTLARQHAQRYPDGAFAQEREVVAIDALVRLDRRDEARSRAERFHARWPSSAHGRRVDVLVAGTP